MAYCANCGNELADGAKFCAVCGWPTAASPAASTPSSAPPPQAASAPSPTAAAPPPPPPAQGYASAPPTATQYAQARYQEPPKRRSLKWLWIALAALAVIVAIVCVLLFVVFHVGGGEGASGPEKAVSELFDAMENQDIDKFFDLMDPEAMGSLFAEDLGIEMSDELLEMAKQAMKEEMFSEGTMQFSDLEFETTETGDTATVRVVAGKVTMTDRDGESETEDVTDADEPVELRAVKRDGKWYVDPETFDF